MRICKWVTFPVPGVAHTPYIDDVLCEKESVAIFKSTIEMRKK